MPPNCPECGEKFSREEGYFLGSIYFNYGLTALIVAIAYPICLFQELVEENVLLGISLAFCIVFPMIFFPFARALWLGFDEFCDPRDKSNGTG
jgi:hypothetical protein